MNNSIGSFTSDGWFQTGDVVVMMEGNFIKVIGQANRLIKIQSKKVLPDKMESVILEPNDIKQCLVYGMANAKTGRNEVAEIIISNETAPENSKTFFRKHCLSKLDRYKVPIKVDLVDKVAYPNLSNIVRSNKNPMNHGSI